MTNSFSVRGEIYYADLSPVKGSEQSGSRPVLIVSNNLMNKFNSLVMIVPMSRNGQKAKITPFITPYEIKDISIFEDGVNYLKTLGYSYAIQDGYIFTHHARSISKDRLIAKVGKVTNKLILEKINFAIKDAFALESCIDCGIPLRPNGLICTSCNKVYRVKCFKCGSVFDANYNYCPICGEGVNNK